MTSNQILGLLIFCIGLLIALQTWLQVTIRYETVREIVEETQRE